MRHTGGVEIHIHSFLTSALHGGVWLTSNPGRFTPAHIQQETGWATVPVLTFWKRGKSLSPAGIPSPNRPVCSLVTVPTTLTRFYLVIR